MRNSHTYGWICKCGSEIDMDVVKLIAIPKCLLCGELMYMMYSIDPQGGIWMNKALLLEEME